MPSEQREQHYDTPHRCRIKGIFEFFEKKGIQLTSEQTNDVFKTMDLPRSSGYNILRGSDRTRHNDPVKSIETRGRPLKMTGAQVAETNKILEEAQDAEEEAMTWRELGVEINTEAKAQTVRNTLHAALNYRKYRAAVKKFMKPHHAKLRVAFAQEMLSIRPNPED